jgi:hypothetical protein
LKGRRYRKEKASAVACTLSQLMVGNPPYEGNAVYNRDRNMTEFAPVS